MNNSTVTFETKCYEKDWEIILKTGRLEAMISRNQYDFDERILYINNVQDPDKVRGYAERLKTRGVITSHVLVEDHADEALAFFGLDRDSFNGGYYYSIQELVGIYLCKTDYLLHFSGDSILEKPLPWIEQAIHELTSDTRVSVATCLWNRKHNDAKRIHQGQNDDFWLVEGFSDQCYLVKTLDFRAQIYHEKHANSEHFPVYGGELFEKRVDAWMRTCGYLRSVYKHGSYLSKNVPRNRILRTAGRLLGLYDY